ncbi:MAG TPA: HEXXH motif-containing putative peptide modification protein [Verrucomicrobiae bacterium]|nr:HEXXH motif-containing putative peptide modification protein [Verrucomicrobiae bacterium]
MRRDLADSLRYILRQADGQLALPEDAFQNFLRQLEGRPVSPLAFSIYCDAVLAIEENDVAEASRLLNELIQFPAHSGETIVSELGNPNQNVHAQRFVRFIDTDPTVRFDVFAPSRTAADNCRALIRDAFTLMDAGDPDLAAEIRALLREIVLAAGTEEPKKMTFDGASSFMLWGGIIINANRRDSQLAMVQMLAHESTHNLLFGLSADVPLVENDDEELFPSPLRLDPRPMDGIYHATFVTARMHRSVHRLLKSGALPEALQKTARGELAENRRLFDKGIKVVREHGKLTSLGDTLMRGAENYMASAN